ncbi:MAG: helix-turn-helix domain-containing protein [Candidatus Cryptobacteroides sp.]
MTYIILYCLTGLLELAAGIMMLVSRKHHQDRSRLLIAVFFLLSAAVIAVVVPLMLNGLYVKGEHVLGTGEILTGFVVFFLLLLYPLEVLRPNWLNARRLLAILAPWLTFSLMLAALSPFGFIELRTPSEILENITRSDVLLRVILAIIFIPYGIWLMFIHYNWRDSSAPKGWIRAIVLIAMAMTVTFSLNRLFGIKWTIYLHLLLYVVITSVILTLEFKVRLKVPQKTLQGPEPPAQEGKDAETVGEPVISPVIGTVSERLRIVMENPEVWQNPDLTRGRLCSLVGTNTTYLNKAIKNLGYASYSDMINRKRVEFVRQTIESGSRENIQDIFYMAGYRSRVTAWRNFTAITGCSPTSLES